MKIDYEKLPKATGSPDPILIIITELQEKVRRLESHVHVVSEIWSPEIARTAPDRNPIRKDEETIYTGIEIDGNKQYKTVHFTTYPVWHEPEQVEEGEE